LTLLACSTAPLPSVCIHPAVSIRASHFFGACTLTESTPLCVRVKEAALDAKRKGDTAKASKYFAQIQALGERLDQANVVVIGQMVGKALRRRVAQEWGNPTAQK